MVGLLVICYYRVDLNHAENDTFPNICIRISHLICEYVCEALKIINQLLPLKRSKYRLIRLLLLHLLYMTKFVLNHS